MFRLHDWDEPQSFKRNRFMDHEFEPQDSLQVWFAGAHADVGGGYSEVASGLAKFPLLWMIDEESMKCGLMFNQQTVNMLAWGVQRKGAGYYYPPPDVLAEVHNSTSWAWRTIEYLPKKSRYREWPARKALFGRYIPNAEPRYIPENAVIHRVGDEADRRDAELSACEPT